MDEHGLVRITPVHACIAALIAIERRAHLGLVTAGYGTSTLLRRSLSRIA
jgi:hypothetical protein